MPYRKNEHNCKNLGRPNWFILHEDKQLIKYFFNPGLPRSGRSFLCASPQELMKDLKQSQLLPYQMVTRHNSANL